MGEMSLEEQLAEITAERDKWRDLARKHENERNTARRELEDARPVVARHEALMKDLAGHLVPALQEAKYVLVNPAGIPTERKK